MFRLEKVFQNDDSGYILFTRIIKSLSIYLLVFIFIILKDNTIYDLLNFEIFKKSSFFLYSNILIVLFFLISFTFNERRNYNKNFISFLKDDLTSIIISNFLIFSIFFIFNYNFKLDLNFIYLATFQIIVLSTLKLYFNYLHNSLIEKNIIQKNIMVVGKYEEIARLLKEKFDKIYVFKCFLITDLVDHNLKFIKSEIKFPIFKVSDDVRSILEYHYLGQIWILNANEKKNEKIFNDILKYSVDTLNIKLNDELNLKGKKLIGNKFDYEFYEYSRFYGINLFFKIIIDKILSILFLIISSPILILAAIGIYLEDGSPILFTQNRTGWDGRRFKIFKLRTLKKIQFDRTKQVSKNDDRLLKYGKIIRRYSIDELPQFFNVLKGDMSIVGPRPHMVEHDIHYSQIFYNFLKRHKCNPGLTGWAQVNGLRGATPKPEIMKRRMEYDLWYLNNWTIYLDMYIIFKTFYALIKYKGD